MIDSSDWTGLPSEIRRIPDGWTAGLTEAQEAEYFRAEHQHDRRERLKALCMLWGPAIKARPRDRLKGWTIYDGYVRQRSEDWQLGRALLAALALILNRRHCQRQVERHRARTGSLYVSNFDLSHWDATSSGYGWSCGRLELYSGCRVAVGSDGESFM